MAANFFEKHQTTLAGALKAIQERNFFSPYSEMPSPKIYGETAKDEAEANFKAWLHQDFPLELAGTIGKVGKETSPFGFELAIHYPRVDVDQTIQAAQVAMQTWSKASVDVRAGVCLEILDRLNKKSFEIAFAVQHTTGQAFLMSFQAGGPHAQDRGLEALAYAYAAMKRVPETAYWEKPQGKNPPLQMNKKFNLIPRGIGLIIGCCTFPTWNTYSALFANLATGNAVLMKPHTGSILPVAITIKIIREVLTEAGFDPNLVTMVANNPGEPAASALAVRPEVKIIDFTGSSKNGLWLEENAKQALVFTEKAGVNCVVIDSTDDFKGMIRNIAFSLSLYTGQMCTAPQNFYIPKEGIQAGDQHLSFEEVVQGIAEGVTKFLDKLGPNAVEVLGAVQNEGVLDRVKKAATLGEVALESRALDHPVFPNARVATPLIIKLTSQDQDKFMEEWFGPVSFMIATENTAESLRLAATGSKEHGAITMAVYSQDDAVLAQAEEAAIEGGVALSCNLTGGVFVNQSAAFSDYHVSGANPAGNACLSDDAFVASRFRVVQVRAHPKANA